MRIRGILLSAATALVFAVPVHGGTCQWRVNPTNVVFGTYSAFGSGPLSATSTYTFRCGPGTQGVLTLTRGVNAPTYFPRYMASGANLIAYNLYDDAANSVVMGDGSGGTTTRVVFNGTPQNKDYTDTIFAAAPQGGDVPPGIYTDTVTATLSWDNFTRSSSVTFTVTAVVQAECTVSTVPVAFGNYDPVVANAVAPLDASGTINVYCTPGTAATVSLGNGLNFAAGSRRMAGPPTSFLNYQLYRNPARTLLWSTTPNTVTGTSASKLTPISGGMIVYGRIPAAQDPLVGAYADTVQATVNY